MSKILIATANEHKVQEIRSILAPLPWEFLSLRDVDPRLELKPPEETGCDYLANALLKARYYGEATGLPCLADDSGLEIEALNGAPGLYSHRFLSQCTHQYQKNERVLELLSQRPWDERRALFRCRAVLTGLEALLGPGAPEYLEAEGICPGFIAFQASGQEGFGYDPIFFYPGVGQHMAQMEPELKNFISHRGRAMRQLACKLGDLFLAQPTT